MVYSQQCIRNRKRQAENKSVSRIQYQLKRQYLAEHNERLGSLGKSYAFIRHPSATGVPRLMEKLSRE